MLGYLLIGICIGNILALKQNTPQQTPQAAQYQQQVPPQRFCTCDELTRCHNEQLAMEQNLISRCRQECGSRIFLDSTMQKVTRCYDEYDRKITDADTHRRRCMEGMGSGQCIGEQRNFPQTVTINTTDFLHSDKKRDHKLTMPAVTALNTCIKICVQNQGIVQFNADGTPVKSKINKIVNGEKQKKKTGVDYSTCATQLNCQLGLVDKKLQKQASKLCRFQTGSNEDPDLHLCTCLESALGQNLHCTEQFTQGTCASTTSQCSGLKN